jgi:hypothetical protein
VMGRPAAIITDAAVCRSEYGVKSPAQRLLVASQSKRPAAPAAGWNARLRQYGERLRWLQERSAAYSTISAFARALDVSESAVRGWRDERIRPTREHMVAVAELIGRPEEGRTIDWLWDNAPPALTEQATEEVVDRRLEAVGHRLDAMAAQLERLERGVDKALDRLDGRSSSTSWRSSISGG